MGDLEVLEERIKCIERKLAEDEEARAKALSLASENLSLRLTNEFATKLMLTDENTKTIVALEAKYETIESKFRAVLICDTVCPVCTSSAQWSTPTAALSQAQPLDFGSIRSAADAQGRVVVAWTQDAVVSGTSTVQVFAMTRSSAGTWSAPVRLDSEPRPAGQPAVAIAARNRPRRVAVRRSRVRQPFMQSCAELTRRTRGAL